MRDVSFVPNEFAKEALAKCWDGTTVIDIACCEAKGEDFPAVIDHEVEFKAEKPASRGFAALSKASKDAMAADAGSLAHQQRRRVDETDSGTLTLLGLEISGQRNQVIGHHFHHPGIAQQTGKFLAERDMDILEVIVFKRVVTGLVEVNQEGHDFTGMHLIRMMPWALAMREQSPLPFLAVVLPKIIDITK